MAEFEKMDLASANLVAERIEQLKQLLPEVATEGGIDFDKLRLVLGDEVDEGTERYAFTWPGKTDAIRQSQTPSTATLRPCPEESVNWDETENLYIEGDNLEVLKLLQHSYHGRMKLIFIDPPYNTGHDFVYRDRFGDTIENYREQAELVGQSNADTGGRYHSAWCSMLYPRLRLARELLSDDGAIFISIDDRERDNLKKICDEIFGESCFVCGVIWRSSDNSNNDAKQFSLDHNTILVYSKMAGWMPLRQSDPEKQSHFKNPDNDPRGPWFDGNPLNSPNYRENLRYDIIAPNGYVIHPPKNGWRWSRETLDEMMARGEIYFNANMTNIKRRTYLADMKGVPPSSLWIDLSKTGHNRQAKYELLELLPEDVFQTPKPVSLIRYILGLVPESKDCFVMDFFAGSSTTADAVMQMNGLDGGTRKCFSIQLPENLDEQLKTAPNDSRTTLKNAIALCEKMGVPHNLCEIGKERIRRAGAKITADVEESNKQLRLGEAPRPVPDIGFRVLKLDESGIVRPKPGELLLDVVKPDRSDEDIIFEMMLKWGLELTLPIEKVDAAGYPCYSVACGELVCCLADGLSMQVLDAIADMEPRRVLMLDRILDDTTKLNAVQAFKRVEEKTGREVELRTV